MIYCGIGSRITPISILNLMTEIGMYLSSYGWVLRSGGAEGADTAFEQGHDTTPGSVKEIYLPAKHYRQHPSELYLEHDSVDDIGAERIGGYVWKKRTDRTCEWQSLKPFTKANMVRDVLQVLGKDIKSECDVVICWTQDGKASGGTGMAMWTAQYITELTGRRIPIINLQNESHRQAIKDTMKGTDPKLLVEHMKGYPNVGFC